MTAMERELPETVDHDPNGGYDTRLDDRSWLRTMYEDAHFSVQRIAVMVRTTDTEVVKALREAGITLRENPGRATRFEKVFDFEYLSDALVVRCLTIRDVARELGCSEQRVHDSLRREGVRVRLAAIGWEPDVAAKRAQRSRVPTKPLPDATKIIAVITCHNDWMSTAQLRRATGVGYDQFHSFHNMLTALTDEGVIARRPGVRKRTFEYMVPPPKGQDVRVPAHG
jgi:hypothetical protein